MSWNTGTSIAQPNDECAHEESGETLSVSYKDDYSTLDTKRKALAEGDVIVAGWVAKIWSLRRISADWGELTISCVPKDPTHTEGEGDDEKTVTDPLEDIWSIKSVRNDVSILAYCGSGNSNPHREAIELWQKETDPDALAQNSYHKPDGSSENLTSAEVELVNKIKKGIDAVIRFYPVVTRKRTYSGVPPACLENLGYIDTPPYGSDVSDATRGKKPNGIGDAINRHVWLKVQDDCDETADRKYNRTEAWMGIPKSDNPDESPWDEDLYGANRWSMPYGHGGSSGGSSGGGSQT